MRRLAKDKRLKVWRYLPGAAVSTAAPAALAAPVKKAGPSFGAKVVKINNGESITVVDAQGLEQRIHFSSTRQTK